MKLIAISVLTVSIIAATTPAFAMKGREATGKCIDTPGCSIHPNGDGGVIIFGPNGGAVECLTLDSECHIIEHGRTSSGDGSPKSGKSGPRLP